MLPSGTCGRFHPTAALYPVYGGCDADLTPRVIAEGLRAYQFKVNGYCPAS